MIIFIYDDYILTNKFEYLKLTVDFFDFQWTITL